ncbi:MAG: hypothetical protein AAFX99_22015, partial [Myxococcota bacterium]
TVSGAGGALLGLIGTTMFAPVATPDLYILGLAGAGIGAAIGLLREQWSSIAVGTAVGALLGAAVAWAMLSFSATLMWPLVIAAAGGAITGIFWGSDRAPRPARAIGFALAAVVGLYVANVLFLSSGSPLALPGIREAATGGVLGLFVSLGTAVGRFRLDNDPIRMLWDEARSSISGDMRELTARGVDLYNEVLARLNKRRGEGDTSPILDDTERVTRETTERLINLGRRWSDIEADVDETTKARLTARLDALEEKIATVNDLVVKAEYRAAADGVRRQLAGFDKIDIARERLIARVHRCLTSLEQVSLMLLQLSTTDAQHASLGLQPELARLDEMTEEFSWKSLSVDDLCELDPPTEMILPDELEARRPTASEDLQNDTHDSRPTTLTAEDEEVTLPPSVESSASDEAIAQDEAPSLEGGDTSQQAQEIRGTGDVGVDKVADTSAEETVVQEEKVSEVVEERVEEVAVVTA